MLRNRSISGRENIKTLFRRKMSEVKSMEISVTLDRSSIYRLLSGAFLYPDEQLFANIQDGAAVKELRACARGPVLGDRADFFNAIQDLESSLEGVTLEGLQAEHRRVFGHTISKECPPYETEYGGAHIFRQTHELGDIAGFYRAFGLEVSDENRERLDHISAQLEFMHFLAYKEAYAREHHGKKETEICWEAQRKFLKEHLGRWAPLFLERLADKAENGFYKELAQLTRNFLVFEARFLNVEPEEIQQFQNVPFDPEGVCAPCDNAE
jgi:DMSO reductase family type II enzyme chaperone